ncbi:MAG: ABC transporter substrate-binding protein [bacterium]
MTYSKDETRIIPWLAESYAIDDSVLTFHLRKGVKFHDDPCFPDGKGRELTAADVKYSFERFYKLRHAGRILPSVSFLGYGEFAKGDSSHLAGFRVLNKHTFEVRLAKPDPDLLRELTELHHFIVPREAVEFYGDDFKWHAVGTGPFRVAEFLPNEKLTLVKNEQYWGFVDHLRLPYLDVIEYVLYSHDASEKMLLDFQAEKLSECTQEVASHLANLVESDNRGRIIFKGWLQEKGVQLVKDEVFRKVRYLQIGGKKKIRQAMSYAINRERLVENQNSVFQKFQTAKGPIPSQAVYFNENLVGQYYDPDKARKLLAEAGHPGGIGLPEYGLIAPRGREFDFMAEDLRAVGFKVKKLEFFPGWRKLLDEFKQPFLLWMTNVNTSPEACEFFYAFLNQEGCVEDKTFVEAFGAWQKNEASLRNKTLLNRLEKIIIDISPIVFLYHLDGEFRFLQRSVRGRQLGAAWGNKLYDVWLDDEARQ